MTVKELKKELEQLPDDVELFVSSMDDRIDVHEFEVQHYEKGDTTIDLIIPIHIVGGEVVKEE